MNEPGVDALLTVDEAIARIDSVPVHPRMVEMPLADAYGLVLAENVAADRDYPPFDKSLMDGFAIRSADMAAEDETRFELRGTVAAGQWPDLMVGAGQAVQIMTGAPMPKGADGVIPVEERVDDPDGKSAVTLRSIEKPQRHVAARGSDVIAGDIVLPEGTRLTTAQLAVAASFGKSLVRVYARPRVAVLGTGDELVAIDATPAPAQIRNSNNVMLASLLKRLGCDVVDMGVVADKPTQVQRAIGVGLGYDVLFVTGGMSMGEFDYVPRTLVELGAKLHVSKLRIRPGKPFVFATIGAPNKFVFGLPGNPVSAFVCTLRLASRLLARMAGRFPESSWRYGKLSAPVTANSAREFYQPARYDGQTVTPLTWKGSADIYTLAKADVLLVRPADASAAAAGDVVRVLEIPQ